MNTKSELIYTLQKHLHWHKSRVDCLLSMLTSIIKANSSNMAKIASLMPAAGIQPSSNYRRIQRFVHQLRYPAETLLTVLLQLMNCQDNPKFDIILDRTNWKLGQTHLNILCSSKVYKGQAIPLFWSILKDQGPGNSTALDRIEHLEFLKAQLGRQRLGIILADREFIGKTWMHYLQDNGFFYCIRLRENWVYLQDQKGQDIDWVQPLQACAVGQCVSLGFCKIGKSQDAYWSHVSAFKAKSDQMGLLMHSADIENAAEVYKKRWEIETTFQALKGRGFDLEATHLKKLERLETLLAVVVLAFCITYRIGIEKSKIKPIVIKKHTYKQCSWSRYGIDQVKRWLDPTFYLIDCFFTTVLNFLTSSALNPYFFVM